MTGLKVIQKQTELVNQIEVLKENKKEMLEILEHQYWLYEYAEIVKAITETEFNQKQLLTGCVFSPAMESFNLGIIIGKRMERAKNKKNKARGSVLLEQIRKLKDENLRLKTLMKMIEEESQILG